MKGKILLTALLMLLMPLSANAPAQAQGGFGKGCVVREWATDATPSYLVNGPAECLGLDRQLDGNDGPNRGRVRAGFRNGNNRKRPSNRRN